MKNASFTVFFFACKEEVLLGHGHVLQWNITLIFHASMPIRLSIENTAFNCLFEQANPLHLPVFNVTARKRRSFWRFSWGFKEKDASSENRTDFLLHFEIARTRHLLLAVEILLAQEPKFGTSLRCKTSNRFYSRFSTPLLLINSILVILTVDLNH